MIKKVYNSLYCSEEYLEQTRAYFTETTKSIMFNKPIIRTPEETLFFAYIIVDEKRLLCKVDKTTMRAYKVVNYESTGQEHKDFTFDRWCTGFDL